MSLLPPFAKRFLHNVKARQGAISNITQSQLKSYLRFLTVRRQSSSQDKRKLLPSVEKFKQLIDSNPILRMNWEYGIYQCERTLPNLNGDDVANFINTACKTPPVFSNSELVGFPINAIFLEFMQNENGRAFFSNKEVNQALKFILDDYQKMLVSPESLEFMNDQSPHGWFSPQAQQKIDYSLYFCNPRLLHYGFKNWNQWFLRQFKPEKRPIGNGSPKGSHPNNVIVNACESTPLVLPLQPQTNVRWSDNFWLKDDVYSLRDMFGAIKYKKQELAKHFIGGTVYQAYLSALNYHRWHSPMDGVVEDIYDIPGTYYFDQSQFIPYDQGSPNNSQSFLSAVATRKIFVINTNNHHIGKIAMIFIGMAQVSSCVSTVQIGDKVQKGQQIGHFEFGGSSHTIVFQKKVKLKFSSELYSKDSNGQLQGVQQNLHSFLAEVIPE